VSPTESPSALDPATPLDATPWIPPRRVTNLRKLGLRTVGDLVLHFPRRHEDRRHFAPFPETASDTPVLICGEVVKASYLPYGRWRRGFQAVLEEIGAGAFAKRIACRWFNMPYVAKMIATGMRMVAYGKPKARGKQLLLDFPEFEMIEEDGEALIHLNRIVPVHPAGEGITPRKLREWIFRAVHTADLTRIPSLLPRAVSREGGTARAAALRAIHFPESFDELESARKLLVIEEFFAMQALITSRRAHVAALPGRRQKSAGSLMARLHDSLPFPLTGAQKRAIAQIRADMASDRRMNRLLQGDVGSGKTLVALSASLLAIEAGAQAAVMAPTQLLAEQHYTTFTRLLAPLGVRVALRTGARRTTGSLELEGAPQLVVGTHALLFEPDELQNPGLIVIDEQHKFGVLQRARLITRADAPDVLVMTATPIPRTLAQTAYGDLDVTVIDEMPAGRGKIITGIRDVAKLPEAAAFLRKQIEAGRQAYIVYPLVEESEKLEAKAASAEFEKWRKLLAPHACGLLHGRMKPEEKDAAMRAFAAGDTKALVATTVIEVGIDVPNANVLLVENAERFGLAQLHQLRGRIGRGAHTSYCILMPGEDTPEAREKLAVLEQTTDGFAVAEADLRQRGPGDLLGTAQTGLPPLRLGNLLRDSALIQTAREQAQRIFESDPQLGRAEHTPLREWLAAQDVSAIAG
jgi:ATP-dependent DNA helicase RecG